MGVELVELDQLSLPGSRITRSPSPTVFGPTRWMRRPAGQCEFVGVTDQNVLKILLKVTDKGRLTTGSECGSCDAGWQVAHYAEGIG